MRKLVKISDSGERIAFRKLLSQSRKLRQEVTKPRECVLCGKEKRYFCNSHTIPRLSLKNISDSGMVVSASYLVGNDILDDEIGLNKSGTIQIICNSCDSIYFQEYENEQNLIKYPSDKMLAQIALKNFLWELVRIREEKYEHEKRISDPNTTKVLRIRNPEISSGYLEKLTKKLKDYYNFFDYDIEDFINEIVLHKTAITTKDSGGYQIIFHEILSYRTPIAFQGTISLTRDMYEYPVNNTKDYSKKNRIQKLHIAILPLEESTMVLMFYHKRDKKYRSLKSQFNSSSRFKKLEFINYLIFSYSDNYYFAPQIKEQIRTDEKLILLSQELFGKPNLGNDIGITDYQRVKHNEIPNFLLEEWALI